MGTDKSNPRTGGGHEDSSDGGEVVGGPRGGEEEKASLIKKRDTHKIKTNPKYKCMDEDSDEAEDDGKQEDFGQLSSKEIDFRETIIKQEKKRLKKERKIKEKE